MHPFYSYNSQYLEGGSSWIGLVSMAMYLAFWGGAIIFIYIMFKRYFINSGFMEGKKDRAMQILRERYAKGEIDFEQFEKIKRDLES